MLRAYPAYPALEVGLGSQWSGSSPQHWPRLFFDPAWVLSIQQNEYSSNSFHFVTVHHDSYMCSSGPGIRQTGRKNSLSRQGVRA